MLIVAGVGTALAVGAALWAVAANVGWARWLWPWLYCIEILGILLVAMAAGGYVAYRWVMRHGGKPFPMAPNSDLPSILKALYIQRRVIGFAIAMQGKDEQTLYRSFGTFLEEHRPKDTSLKTQQPGIIPVWDAKP
jgi:hypothetical protein